MLAFIRMLIGCLLTAVAIVGVAAGVGFWVYHDVTEPGPLAAAHTTVIPPHTGISGISDLLADEGVIRHPLSFKVAAEVTGRGGALKAGEYEFPAAASAVQVMDLIATGKTVKHRLTIREGLTSPEIVALVRDAPLLTGDVGPVPAEGQLLPETYVYSRGDTRESLIERMQQAMQEALAAAWAERRADLPLLSPQDALTLASIVEKESSRDEERAHVAAVFLNRLRLGMRLQADPTAADPCRPCGGFALQHLCREGIAARSDLQSRQGGDARCGAARAQRRSLFRRRWFGRPCLRQNPGRAQPQRRGLPAWYGGGRGGAGANEPAAAFGRAAAGETGRARRTALPGQPRPSLRRALSRRR
jgi:UPF0755 protein